MDVLSDDQLRIAIYADSPSSADKSCLAHGIHGQTKIRIGAVAQILRDYPETVLSCGALKETARLRSLIDSMPNMLRNEILDRINIKRAAWSLKDKVANKEVVNANTEE